MLESLTYVARIRDKVLDEFYLDDGGDDYILTVEDNKAYLQFCHFSNTTRTLPLTEQDVLKMLAAFQVYKNMKILEADHVG